MVGTRSLSSGAHSRDPVALPTLQLWSILPPDPRPGLAAAQRADAAFDAQRIRACHRDAARIGAAVIGIIDLARPFAGRYRLHPAEQRQADHRPLLQGRIGILVIDLGLAGGRIDRLLEAHDHAADTATAFADFHPRVAGLGLPDAGRLAGALRAS